MDLSNNDVPDRSSNQNSHIAPLESLVSYLLASKRSLSSVSHVMRANELVTSTRGSLESNVVTTARTEFLRSGIEQQVQVLEHIHEGSDSVAQKGDVEFQDVLKRLDRAEQRLGRTLDTLRETLVEAGLRPEGEARRNLLDFVDESGVETLLTKVKQSVDDAGRGHKGFGESNKTFSGELREVKKLLSGRKARIFEDSVEDTEIGSPIPEILTLMEDHARDMADNLESLVKHYDLCVSAIKHTEGGGDAAHRIAGTLPEGGDIGETNLDASPEPITEDERVEMICVVEKDAGQVDEVIVEIRDGITEIEAQAQMLATFVKTCAEEDTKTNAAFKSLEDIGRRLPAFINQSQVFLMRWDNDKTKLEEHMEELDGLRDFYGEFLKAYDKLLIEVGRRTTLDTQVERIVEDAMSKIGKLYDDDAEAREAFRVEQGDFLPVDIWPGMTSGPARYEMVLAGDAQTKPPDISKAAIQRAIDRISRHNQPDTSE